ASPPAVADPATRAKMDALTRQMLEDDAREKPQREAELEAAITGAGMGVAPVVTTVASRPEPPLPPAAFEVGARLLPQARDPTGGQHLAAGLLFSWLALATEYGRGSIVLDLESTRLQPGRDDRTDRARVAFYGAGFDWTLPFASHGTGLYVGAEAEAG